MSINSNFFSLTIFVLAFSAIGLNIHAHKHVSKKLPISKLPLKTVSSLACTTKMDTECVDVKYENESIKFYFDVEKALKKNKAQSILVGSVTAISVAAMSLGLYSIFTNTDEPLALIPIIGGTIGTLLGGITTLSFLSYQNGLANYDNEKPFRTINNIGISDKDFSEIIKWSEIEEIRGEYHEGCTFGGVIISVLPTKKQKKQTEYVFFAPLQELLSLPAS